MEREQIIRQDPFTLRIIRLEDGTTGYILQIKGMEFYETSNQPVVALLAKLLEALQHLKKEVQKSG